MQTQGLSALVIGLALSVSGPPLAAAPHLTQLPQERLPAVVLAVADRLAGQQHRAAAILALFGVADAGEPEREAYYAIQAEGYTVQLVVQRRAAHWLVEEVSIRPDLDSPLAKRPLQAWVQHLGPWQLVSRGKTSSLVFIHQAARDARARIYVRMLLPPDSAANRMQSLIIRADPCQLCIERLESR